MDTLKRRERYEARGIIQSGVETKIIHAGHSFDPTTNALASPIYQTATFGFETVEDMDDSHNAGVLFLGGDRVRVRTAGEPKEYDLGAKNDLPAELETLLLVIRDKYGYLFA